VYILNTKRDRGGATIVTWGYLIFLLHSLVASHHSHSPSCWSVLPLLAQLTLNAQLLAAAEFAKLSLALLLGSKLLQSGKVRLKTLLPSVVLHSPFNGRDERAGSKGRAGRPVTVDLLMAPKWWDQPVPGLPP
jgi:hypothetical protein